MIKLGNDWLTIAIAELGAELQSVTDARGRDWLWNGDASIWAGRSPLLFPVIGKHPDGKVLIDGQRYPIKSHGVARTSLFAPIVQDGTSCTLRLTDTDETRQAYPFAFALDMTYRLDGAALTMTARISNTGDKAMPFCFGYHPALLWPLPDAQDRPHRIRLGNGASPAHLRLGADGQRAPALHPSVFVDGVLTLDHALFVEDALIIPEGTGGHLWYGADGLPGVAVDFPGMPHLGIWTKPNGPYICIEPWHGLPSPSDPDEPLERRAGVIKLAPGAAKELPMTLTFGIPCSG